MQRKTLFVLIAVAIFIMAGVIALRYQTYGTGRVCRTNMVYKEIDLTLLPVDSVDKALKVIENTLTQLNLTTLYSEKYEIESYEKYVGQKNPGPPYNILIPGYSERFSVLRDGTVERTLCAE